MLSLLRERFPELEECDVPALARVCLFEAFNRRVNLSLEQIATT
jgi:hypothetical protein